MPLYEYRCAKCSRVFEVLQKFSDTPLRVHPGCGGKVEKLISASGFSFKGSGFYITDYARAGAEKAEKKDGSPSETKGEAKPDAATTESKPATDSKPASPPAESKPAPAPAKAD